MRKVLGTTALIASLFAATPALACGMYIPSEMNLAEAMEQIEIDPDPVLVEAGLQEPEVVEDAVVEAEEQELSAEAQEAAQLEEARQAMEALRLALEPATADASEDAPPAS
jgi:hypothetical protein